MKRDEKAEIFGCASLFLFLVSCWSIWTRFIPDVIDQMVPSKMPFWLIALFIIATALTARIHLRLSRPQDIKTLKRGIFY
jgi:hypothetical protein